MQKKTKVSLWVVFAVMCAAVVAFLVIHRLRNPLTITGAVTIQDADARKELPIADVEISVANGAAESSTKSDASGFFTLKLKKWIRKNRPITLQFRHPNYQPLDLPEFANNKLYVARMVPITKRQENVPSVAIGNVRVRYSIKAPRTM